MESGVESGGGGRTDDGTLSCTANSKEVQDIVVSRESTGRLEVWEQLQQVVMAVIWAIAMVAKMLLIFLPHQLPAAGLVGMLENFSERKEKSRNSIPLGPWSGTLSVANSKTPICRALVQVLELMNEIPASSRKYPFTRELAEKIIEENAAGCLALGEVNRTALEAGFSRTIYLLTNSLENVFQQQQAATWSWAVRILKSLPSSSLTFLPVLANVWNGFGSSNSQSTAEQFALVNAEAAEKFSQELFWMAQKLKENSAIESAIFQWSSASQLANLTNSATPRVQRLLVKLSAMLCVELSSSIAEAPKDLKLKFLLLWIPLFCSVSPSSADGNVFSASERVEVEKKLERIIRSLPDCDQEIVLALWLREFTISMSDWPNLQGCYDEWCHESRRFDHLKLLNEKQQQQ